jgi:hypothetical protein
MVVRRVRRSAARAVIAWRSRVLAARCGGGFEAASLSL